MNYLDIRAAKENLYRHFKNIQQLEREINSSLSTLSETLLTPEKKDQTWQVLEKKGENMSNQIAKELHELEGTRFSLESDKLKEEKARLIDQYRGLIEALNKKKSFIAEQMRKKNIPIIPFRPEEPEVGYCYSCKVDISNSFSYQLERELQSILNIKIAEEARFCSKDCLSKYCKKYEEWNKSQQVKREAHQTKITENRKLLTQLQEEKTHLQEKINNLRESEQRAELLYKEEILAGGEKKVSKWKRFLLKLGIAKDNSPRANLLHLRRLKQGYEGELEKKNAKIQQVLLSLSIDKQFDQEWEETEEKFLRLSEKEKKEEENE